MRITQEVIERAKRIIYRRQIAYRQIFDLQSPMVEIVLLDLAKFCRAHETSFTLDPRTSALIEGRREVWLRIQQHLNLDSQDLWKLYGGGERATREDNV